MKESVDFQELLGTAFSGRGFEDNYYINSNNTHVADGYCVNSNNTFVYHNEYDLKGRFPVFNRESISFLMDFIQQSVKETEVGIKTAKQNNDMDEYNWLCGFSEALAEITSKIEELKEYSKRLKMP